MQHWTLEMEKQVGDRLQTILKDPQLLSVYQEYGGDILRRSSVFHGLRKFLTENNVKGHTCFEVGTWNGLTAVVLSAFFKRVISVDIAHNGIKHEVIKHLGITNISCIDIKDNDEKAAIARSLRFDAAYLDGNHADDTGEDWNLVRHCEQVIFHEAWEFQPPVWELVNSLPQDKVVYGGSGLALYRK
jgi:hypothetical protein